MYENDIKLTNEGSTQIINGDFVLTDNDMDFIVHMLTTSKGGWKLHSDLGTGLEKFIGSQNNQKTYSDIRFTISTFFKKFGMVPLIQIYSIDQESILCDMTFHIIGNITPLNLSFNFTFSDGTVKFPEDVQESTIETINHVAAATRNKYFKRR